MFSVDTSAIVEDVIDEKPVKDTDASAPVAVLIKAATGSEFA